MKVLVTGAAGFIGSFLSQKLLGLGHEVVGYDNINDYYDVSLKHARLERLKKNPQFTFQLGDVADLDTLNAVFAKFQPNRVVHLAAQAGVRYSLTNPHVYGRANLAGFINILECSRHNRVEHLVFASSSSVYGANKSLPFSEQDNVDHPVSLYAATKKANELMAHSYSHLFNLPTTGLRFFTVYGPWGRPDMALFLFTKNILAGKPIDVFNHGRHRRDFTYIDDIVEGVYRVLMKPPTGDAAWNGLSPNPASSAAPYRVYNIGNNAPVWLDEMIACIEEQLGRKAVKNLLPMQDGDVPETCADVSALERDMGFKPKTTIAEGVSRFIPWYLEFYGAKGSK